MRSSVLTRSLQYLPLLVAHLIANAQSANTEPLSVPFGPDYIGYDGQWSPVQIRVGTPQQYLNVLPSTTSSENWLGGQTLCDGTTCASLRGGIFYSANSSTWEELGAYELGYSALSQSTPTGDYGFDTLAISDTISTSNQIFAVVDDLEHWIGTLGLGVQETRFSNNSNHLSLISTLVQNNSAIPSHSYGYTAGASYQSKGLQGSLTLGGVDSTRYTASDTWFTLASGYVPSTVLRSIQIGARYPPQQWTANPLRTLADSDAITVVFDSSTPFLWLPESVCESIATALNLTWDATLELYLPSNSTTPQDLNAMDLEFTFNFAQSTTTSDVVVLKLSYGAFNLQLSYPFPGAFTDYSEVTINYFPLRRANNSQQYTIGRAFLQETYLIVDYERNVFSLSQALFPDTSTQPQLAAIQRPSNSGWPGPPSASSGLTTGAKVGIAVGIVVAVVAVAALVWFFSIKRRRDRSLSDDEKSQKTGFFSFFSKRSTGKSMASTTGSAAELNADKHHPSEMISDSSNSRFELSTATAPAEMPAGEVAPTYFQERTNARIAQRNDPRAPIELVQPQTRGSIDKTGVAQQTAQRDSTPAPAYSPHGSDRNNSQSISPYSQRHHSNPFQSGSDHIISPVTGSNSDRDRFSHAQHSRNGSGSAGLLSPISPMPRSDGQSSPAATFRSTGAPQSASGESPVSRSLSPGAAARNAPRRTPSRDSRFREDLTESTRSTTSETPQPTAPVPAGSSLSDGQSRYSWEK